ncbi:hypothetical protein KY334_00680 [Candidatus Woesearchaeota archaeon]|nr:hypothetical protein [Candidatus Woesearchaeota archaeon]
MAYFEDDRKGRKTIIIAIFIFSLILYFTGVMSGLYANKIIKEETEDTINTLTTETKNNIQQIDGKIDSLYLDIDEKTLDNSFHYILTEEERCNYYEKNIADLTQEIKKYWKILPYRIEEYEKNNQLSEEYNNTKKEYMLLSLKLWMNTKRNKNECDNNIIDGLYFYSSDCDNCIEQGQNLDYLNELIYKQNKTPVIFTIDYNLDVEILETIKEYYEINSTPTIMVNNLIFRDEIISSEEIIEELIRNGSLTNNTFLEEEVQNE